MADKIYCESCGKEIKRGYGKVCESCEKKIQDKLKEVEKTRKEFNNMKASNAWEEVLQKMEDNNKKGDKNEFDELNKDEKVAISMLKFVEMNKKGSIKQFIEKGYWFYLEFIKNVVSNELNIPRLAKTVEVIEGDFEEHQYNVINFEYNGTSEDDRDFDYNMLLDNLEIMDEILESNLDIIEEKTERYFEGKMMEGELDDYLKEE